MQYFQQLTESDILKQPADFNQALNEIKKNHDTSLREYLHNCLNKLITEKKIINKINRDQDSYRINRYMLKIHEFDQTGSPVSLSNSLFNNSLYSIIPPLTIETSSPGTMLNITERLTATGTLLIDTSRN